MDSIKRIAFFVHWNPGNLIHDYVIHYLAGLKTVAQEIVFISNSPVLPGEETKLNDIVSHKVFRKNSGLDFGAWKEALDKINKTHLNSFDEIILANDSCYGPITPFRFLFSQMNPKAVDFWGITAHPMVNSIPYHIQSYFLVFKNKVFSSRAFQDFFNTINKNAPYDEVVTQYETQLTQYFKKQGFSCGAFFSPQELDCSNDFFRNYSLHRWMELLKLGSPLLKRKIFKRDFHFELFNGYIPDDTIRKLLQLKNWKSIVENVGGNLDSTIIEDDLNLYMTRNEKNLVNHFLCQDYDMLKKKYRYA